MQTHLDGVYCRIKIPINKVAQNGNTLKRPSHPEYILLEGSLLDDQPSTTMTQPPSRTAPVLLGKQSCTQPSIYDLC